MRYTFGDTITADERLKNISEVFNPFSAEFIRENIHGKINSVIDLGCGPGYSTEMVAESTSAKIVTGIDISENFLLSAAARYKKYTFIKCNITTDFPPIKSDVIYFRFLLSHLKNINELLLNWINHLNKNGILIIDELEDIYTDNDLFYDYITINQGLIASQGTDLFVGRTLDRELTGLKVLAGKSYLHRVPDYKAALMFYPNTISIWEKEDWIKKNVPEDKRKRISERLYFTSNEKSEKSTITWKMKRIILCNNL